MRANRKSGVPSEVEAINTNPLLSQLTSVPTEKPHPRQVDDRLPATLFENMDTRITYSRTCDSVRKLIAKKTYAGGEILAVVVG